MSDVSQSLRSLTKNERMSESLVFMSKSLIHSFFAKKERFAQKTDEQISSPGKGSFWGAFNPVLTKSFQIHKIFLPVVFQTDVFGPFPPFPEDAMISRHF